MRICRLLLSAFLLVIVVVWAAQTVSPGQYAGSWSGAAGGSGKIRLTLTQAEGAPWSAKAEFTLDGTTVPCKVQTVSVTEDKVQVSYDFELQGARLRSTLNGTASGSTLKGRYTTTVVPDGSSVDNGEFTATLEGK